jgi:aspartate/tyrosine/aromatic aminotransferase
VGVQTLNGTGALRVSAEFFSKILNFDTVYSSEPKWSEQIRARFNNLIYFESF